MDRAFTWSQKIAKVQCIQLIQRYPPVRCATQAQGDLERARALKLKFNLLCQSGIAAGYRRMIASVFIFLNLDSNRDTA